MPACSSDFEPNRHARRRRTMQLTSPRQVALRELTAIAGSADPAFPDAAAAPLAFAAPPARGLLKMRDITVHFSSHARPILDRIDLTCAPGEFVVLVGPSGCGKTTLLNVV